MTMRQHVERDATLPLDKEREGAVSFKRGDV